MSLFINVNLELEQEYVKLIVKSLKVLRLISSQRLTKRYSGMIIKALLPCSAAVSGWFGLYEIGTCMTLSLLEDLESLFHFNRQKNDTFCKGWNPRIQLCVLCMICKIHHKICKVYFVKL